MKLEKKYLKKVVRAYKMRGQNWYNYQQVIFEIYFETYYFPGEKMDSNRKKLWHHCMDIWNSVIIAWRMKFCHRQSCIVVDDLKHQQENGLRKEKISPYEQIK